MSSNEWKEGELQEIADITMGQSPTGDTCNELKNGLPLLNGPTEFGPSYPFPVQYTTDPKRFAEINDLLFCVRGSTTGRMNWADQKYAIGRGLAAIRHKKGQELQPFVKAVIDYNLPTVLAEATGSTFPNVSSQQLKGLKVKLPPIATQRRIASILSSLDDKLELNRQTNQTLEAIAQALFKEWFVDFNFPGATGEMVESELGMIPKGWRVGKLGDLVVKITKGTTPTTGGDKFVNDGINFLRVDCILEDGIVDITKALFIDAPTNEKLKRSQLQLQDILITIAGSLGRIGLVTSRVLPANTNQAIALIRVDPDKIFMEYAYYYLRQRQTLNDLLSRATQSVQPNVSLTDLNQILVLVPNEFIMNSFSSQASAILEKIESNIVENLYLAQLRDSLLPKLMKGEIEVN